MSNYDKYKDMLTKLDKADWNDAEQLVLAGEVNSAIETLILIVPDAARSYAKAAAIHNLDFDDIVAVGNVALVEAVHSWRPGGINLKNWCYQKVSRDIGRHVGKELNYIMQNDEELPDEHEDEPIDPSMSAEDQLSESQVKEWLEANLTPKENEIVNLVYFRGLRVREIARQKGVSAEAISKVHRRVLKKLAGEVDILESAGDIL